MFVRTVKIKNFIFLFILKIELYVHSKGTAAVDDKPDVSGLNGYACIKRFC
jgi:hypothetical protein